jgi:hypothetical protein
MFKLETFLTDNFNPQCPLFALLEGNVSLSEEWHLRIKVCNLAASRVSSETYFALFSFCIE